MAQKTIKSNRVEKIFYLYGSTEETISVGDDSLNLNGVRWTVLPIDPTSESNVTVTIDGVEIMYLLGNGVWPSYIYGTAATNIVFTPTNAKFSIMVETGVATT